MFNNSLFFSDRPQLSTTSAQNENNNTFNLSISSTVHSRNITVLLKNKRKNSRQYFDNLLQAITECIKDFTQKEFVEFDSLLDLTDKALLLMEIDIYLPSSVPAEKSIALENVCKIIKAYFEKNPEDVFGVVKMLDIISRNNFEAYYDYNWLREEKYTFFGPINEMLTKRFQSLLEKEQDNTDKIISMEMIAIVVAAISFWIPKSSSKLIEELIVQMVTRFKSEMLLSAELSFQFLCAVTLMWMQSSTDTLRLSRNLARSQLFVMLIQQALPLFTQADLPLRIDNVESVSLRRISQLKELLSFVTFNARTETFKQALLAMSKKEEELLNRIRSNNNAKPWSSNFDRPDKIGGKWCFDLNSNIYLIHKLREYPNPKGLQWVILRRSNEILQFLKENITYPVENIKNYLKQLRHCVWDINIHEVREVILRLGQEVLQESHIGSVDFSLAIELLWINMVLSCVLRDNTIAYSTEDQTKLFEKIQNCQISNEEQARALFEIKTMQWHGRLPFTQRLLHQMAFYFKNFSKSTNASNDEQLYYSVLEATLSTQDKEFLKQNLICEDTGHEIDIAYISPGKRKIAIHIDGPNHFEAVTRQPTHKTNFRNLCLEKAGWDSVVVNLIETKTFQQRISDMLLKFTQLVKTEAEIDQSIVPSVIQIGSPK